MQRGSSAMTDPDDEVTRLADEAVAAFQARAGGSLDFTQGSLAAIDDMLNEAAPFVSDLDPLAESLADGDRKGSLL
jgi:hypothetical protein